MSNYARKWWRASASVLVGVLSLLTSVVGLLEVDNG